MESFQVYVLWWPMVDKCAVSIPGYSTLRGHVLYVPKTVSFGLEDALVGLQGTVELTLGHKVFSE